MPNKEDTPVVEVRSLCKDFRVTGENSLFAKTFTAVKDVNFQVFPGETFGIVGESGCGKSTVAKLIMCIEKPTAGEVYLKGQRIDSLPEGERRRLRPRFQMVFQDSGSSLNPRKRVGDIIREPLLYHRPGKGTEADSRVEELLSMVGLPAEMKNRYPHELSGGQRQRVCIAKAISLLPDVIVLDEPVSALDVSVQAQILNLLRELQEKLGLTYIFIGHGLGAVHYISHRIAVMYMGSIVEAGESDALFDHPAHPYTKALLDAAPTTERAGRSGRRVSLKGEIDTAAPSGACPLYHRCPWAREECLRFENVLRPLPGEAGHVSACMKAREG